MSEDKDKQKNNADETVFSGASDETILNETSDETVYAGASGETLLNESLDSTVLDESSEGTVFIPRPDTTKADQAALAEAEKQVSLEWNVGDIILNLYEVLPVEAGGKAFHAGGFGKVYKVHHKSWDTDLAVKSPHAHAFKTEAQKQNFINECEAWIELGLHPNIASCYYVRELGGVPRIFAEYVDDGSLKEWISGRRIYNGGKDAALKRILDFAIQFAWGLQYAHEKGMIHQDVKPQNVMITKQGEVKVVDFGLAHARGGESIPDGDAQQTVMLTSFGGYTPAYCSPEQAANQPLTRRTDIWSWAVSVMEMFIGEATWTSGAIAAFVLEDYLEAEEPPENGLLMPEGVSRLLKQCFLEKEEDRPHTMMEIADALIKIYEDAFGVYPRIWQESASASADALNNRALSYLDMGKQEKAEEAWGKALETDPQHVASIFNQGLVSWRKGQSTYAAVNNRLNDAMVKPSQTWLKNYLIGWMNIEANEPETALGFLSTISDRSDDPSIRFAVETAKEIKETLYSDEYMVEPGFDSPSFMATEDNHFAVIGKRGERRIELWDVLSGVLVKEIDKPEWLTRPVAVSSDGTWAAELAGRFIIVWDIKTGEKIMDKLCEQPLTKIGITPDGRFVVMGGKQGKLTVLEIPSGECVLETQGYAYATEMSPGSITSISFSRDGGQMLIGDFFGAITLYDTSRWTRINTIHDLSCRVPVCSAAISDDGECIAARYKDAQIRLWQGNYTWTFLKIDRNLRDDECTVIFSDDNKRIISHAQETSIWDIETGKCLRRITDKNTIAVSNQGGDRLAFEKQEALWAQSITLTEISAPWYVSKPESSSDAAKREEIIGQYVEDAEAMLNQKDFTAACKTLRKAMEVSGSEENAVFRNAWALLYPYLPRTDLTRIDEIPDFETAVDEKDREIKHNDVKISPDGSFALSAGDNGKVLLWDIKAKQCVHVWEMNDARCRISISGDGCMAAVTTEKDIRLIDLKTKEVFRRIKIWPGILPPYALRRNTYPLTKINADGRLLLAGTHRRLKMFNPETGKCLKTYRFLSKNVVSAAIDLASTHMVISTNDGKLWLIRLKTGKVEMEFEKIAPGFNEEYKGTESGLTFTAGGRFFYSGNGTKLRMWDCDTGKCVRELVHADVRSVEWPLRSFSATLGGEFLLAGYSDGSMAFFDIKSGSSVQSLGNKDNIQRVSASADGRYAARVCNKGELKFFEILWDLKERDPQFWDDKAEAILWSFLDSHQPVKGNNPLKRKGIPEWTEKDFEGLMTQLSYSQFGYLEPEGVRYELEQLKKRYSKY